MGDKPKVSQGKRIKYAKRLSKFILLIIFAIFRFN